MGRDYLSETQKFQNPDKYETISANTIIREVHSALKEKGYNPVNQIVGYIMSGDPTYITGHNGARNLIGKLERDELLEELTMFYLKHNL